VLHRCPVHGKVTTWPCVACAAKDTKTQHGTPAK
jgi:hypothetical protein